MKEPYGVAVATDTDPKLCVGDRKGADEALTGVRMGWVLSRESRRNRGADAFLSVEGNIGGIVNAMMPPDPARSQTPRTCGNSMHRSWEIPCPTRADRTLARAVNSSWARRR